MSFKKIFSFIVYSVFFSSICIFGEEANSTNRISTTAKKRKNVVEININMKNDGNIDVSKKSKILPGDPDKRILTVKDSDTGNPVPEADVEIDSKWKVLTNRQGNADLPEDVEDGEHSLVITKGTIYARTETTFVVVDGELSSASQFSVPKVVDYERIKIILDWGETPSDLDSHILSENHHVYFSNMQSGNLYLDRDDTTSYGPETVTVRDMKSNDVYEYYVFDYSNRNYPQSKDMSNSNAQVRVFLNNDLVRTYHITPDKEGILWHVFDVVNGTEIIDRDTISDGRL